MSDRTLGDTIKDTGSLHVFALLVSVCQQCPYLGPHFRDWRNTKHHFLTCQGLKRKEEQPGQKLPGDLPCMSLARIAPVALQGLQWGQGNVCISISAARGESRQGIKRLKKAPMMCVLESSGDSHAGDRYQGKMKRRQTGGKSSPERLRWDQKHCWDDQPGSWRSHCSSSPNT